MVVTSPTDPMPEPLEQRVNCFPSIATLVKEDISALLLPALIKKALEKAYWAGEFDVTLEAPHETQVGYWHLTEEETRRVLAAARKHSTTVHAILFSASVFATKAVFLSKKNNNDNNDDDDQQSSFSTSDDALVFTSPVSIRDLTHPHIARHDLGCYSSEMTTRDIRIALDTCFWDLAKTLRDQTVQSTKTTSGVRRLLEHVGPLQFLPNHRGALEEFLRGRVNKEQHGRQGALELSNVGRVWEQAKEDEEKEKRVVFKVVEGVFSQSAMITGPALILNAATANEVLTVVGTWQRATFSGREKGEAMMKAFKRILIEATSIWRIIVVHVKQDDTYYLLYNFQHSISDGRSGMMFSELLVERLNHEINNPTAAASNPAIIPTSNEPLPPSIEQRTDCRPSIKTLLKEATMILFLPGPLKRMLEKKYWSGDIDASAKAPHETLISYIALTQEETKKIVAAAKVHKTTVNTMLFTASMFALKSLFLTDVSNKTNPSTTKDKFCFSTAVALRNMISPPIDKYDQGVYLSEAVTKNIKVKLETPFWGLSHMYGASIIKSTQTPKGNKKLLEHAGLLEYLPNTRVPGRSSW
ncbi:MAG: hypothetical protein BYD32DRAFT_205084 [Podila humilis]|nr:MAG: hypothetical protein BYD32DRAFT_205084 [Podila humilis]